MRLENIETISNGDLDTIGTIKRSPWMIAFTDKLSTNVLNQCKSEIITYILTKLKSKFSKYELLAFIDLIQHTHWPELTIIKNSIKATK